MRELEILKRKLDQEINIRKEADRSFKQKVLDLHQEILHLQKANQDLSNKIDQIYRDLHDRDQITQNTVKPGTPNCPSLNVNADAHLRGIEKKKEGAEKEFIADVNRKFRMKWNQLFDTFNLLKDQPPSSCQLTHLQTIITYSDTLKTQTTDVLELLALDVKAYKRSAVGTNELLTDIKEFCASRFKDLILKFHIDPDLTVDHTLLTSHSLITKIFFNILDHIDKSSSKDPVHISFVLDSESTSHLSIKFLIESHEEDLIDTGHSLVHSRDTAQKKSDYLERDLGLAIASRAIDIMDGNFSFEERPGIGTRIFLSLPFEKETTATAEQKSNASASKFDFPLPLLIVEDNAINQKYITRILDKWGVTYHLASNGRECLEKVNTELYCMILMDLQMPVMDGFEATKLIRDSEKLHLQKIPIIALTASNPFESKEAVAAHGLSDYLAKPFSPKQLAAQFELCCLLHKEEYMQTLKRNTFFTFDAELDSEYLETVFENDLKYILEMFEIFLNSVPKEFNLLKSAIAEKNSRAILQLSHKIKPAFAMVGLTKESNTLEEIERDIFEENFSNFEDILCKLNHIQRRVQIIDKEEKKLRSFLDSGTSQKMKRISEFTDC